MLRGRFRVPGDKSISHRAVLFPLLGRRPVTIDGRLRAGDVDATIAAVRALGAEVVEEGPRLRVSPPAAIREPDAPLDCGNSGTTMRLLAGLLAAEPVHAVLTGDASLRRRPMARIAGPLRAMGAHVDGRAGGTLAPLAIRGGALRAADHDLAVASAQVKSALLLAGRRSGVRVREPARSRDHSERLLRAMGAAVAESADGWLTLAPGPLEGVDVVVPGDLSAAAFPLVAAALVPGSELVIPGVGVNPTRSGVLDALRAMGADLEVIPRADAGGEPVADLVIRHRPLRATRIDGALALRSLDELVVLAVAAAFAEGVTTIADAAELRVKESDRIARVADGLRALGIAVVERPDGMEITGGRPRPVPGAAVDATHDHRIAMAFAVADLAVGGGLAITGGDAVESSWPSFRADLAAVSSAPLESA